MDEENILEIFFKKRAMRPVISGKYLGGNAQTFKRLVFNIVYGLNGKIQNENVM